MNTNSFALTAVLPAQDSAYGPASGGLRPISSKAVFASKKLVADLKAQYHSRLQVVSQVDVSKVNVNVSCESAPMKTVVVSLPTYLDWEHPINEMEKLNDANRPGRHTAVKQHIEFIRAMLNHDLKVILIEPSADRLESVYTRDIGFAIGPHCFQSNLVRSVRQAEESTIIGGIKPPAEVKIEGGNVIVHGNTVFVGVGDRTNSIAVDWLQLTLKKLGSDKKVIPLHLKPGILHVDCVFLPLTRSNGERGTALIHPAAFQNPDELRKLRHQFETLIEVDPREVPMLGLNAPCVDERTRLVSHQATGVIKILKDLQFAVEKINLGEIIKAEGGPRCSTFPLAQNY